MNAPATTRDASQKLSIVDCDIHPAMRSPADLGRFLAPEWHEHWKTYGAFSRSGMSSTFSYPRMMAGGMRLDSFPAGGGAAGSDLDLMRSQLLDLYGVEAGILIALAPGPSSERNQDYAAALARAMNDWQIETWCKPEPRLRAGIGVAQDDAAEACAEIARCAGDRRFVQINMAPRSIEPIGRRRYWPIYEMAQHYDLPIGLHVAGQGGHAPTGGGFPTFYIQDHYANVPNMHAVVASMVLEGVFEQFPKLKVVLIEGGFTWVPALCWRLDTHWKHMRSEVPRVKRPPSDYVREHFWYTTQPIEEPENPRHLKEIIDWIGWDRILFSSDYPHWDMDDPQFVFKARLDEAQRTMVFRDNARALYRL